MMDEDHKNQEEDEEEFSIDFDKIKNFFKKKKEPETAKETIKKAEEEIEKKIEDEKEKFEELKQEEIYEEKKIEEFEQKKEELEKVEEKIEEKAKELKELEKKEIDIKKEEQKVETALQKEEEKIEKIEKEIDTETKTLDEGDEEELSFDFSKIKNIFKRDSERKKESAEEDIIDLSGTKEFMTKNKAIIIPVALILIAIFFSTFFRMYPADLPITDNWAKDSAYNFYKNQIKNEINQQYPNLPEINKQGLIENEFQKVLKDKKGEIEQQIKATSQHFKSRMQDEEGQTYLLAIDPYLWYGETRNYLENGHFGTEIVEGEEINLLRNGREGRKMPGIKLHSLFGAYLHKITSIFTNNSLMATFFLIPVIIIGLAIIPAFFIGQKIGGNLGGFFAAMILAVNAALLGRTPAGFADTDPYNIFFPLLIGWLFLEAYDTKNTKTSLILTGLAGLFTGLYSASWGGWWYIFGFILATSVLYAIYQKIKENKNEGIFVATSFFIFTGIGVTLISGFSTFYAAFKSPIGVIILKEVAVTTLWPNVLTTVAEFNEAPLSALIGQMGGNILFFIAILGILLTIFIKKDGKRDIKYAIFLTIWFVGTAYGFTKGIRFGILMVPAFAIAFGAGAGIIYQYVSKWITKELHINKTISQTVIIIVLLLLLISPIKAAATTAKSEVPSMNDAWYESLTTIKNDCEDGIITSWWDFGHWFVAIAERRVTFDGADQGERIHWVGKSLLTNNEKEAVGILRMLNCGQEKAPHILEEIFNGNTVKAIDILNEIILVDKKEAIEMLEKEGLTKKETEQVIEMTHCNNLIDQYYITSEDMIGKSGVWGHFGSWDFKKAQIWQTVRKMDYTEGVNYMTKEHNLTEEKADQYYYEIQEEKADEWVAPWPRYQTGLTACNEKDNMIICGNGIRINRTTMEGEIQTNQGAQKLQSVGFINDKQEFEIKKADCKVPMSTVLIRKNNKLYSIAMDPEQAGSMFTRLFFLDGHGLKHFSMLSDKIQITGGRIQVWKVSWEEKEPINILATEEEIKASHILITTKDKNSSEAYKKIIEVSKEINETNFAEIAEKYSEGPTGPKGGDLGWFKKGMMVPEFEKATLELEIGEVSKPVKTQFGYHIIKLTGKRGGETTPEITEKEEEIKEVKEEEPVEEETTEDAEESNISGTQEEEKSKVNKSSDNNEIVYEIEI